MRRRAVPLPPVMRRLASPPLPLTRATAACSCALLPSTPRLDRFARRVRRSLNYNAITGTLPDVISSLTALTQLCVGAPRCCLHDAPSRLFSSPLLHVLYSPPPLLPFPFFQPPTRALDRFARHFACRRLDGNSISGTLRVKALGTLTALTTLCVPAPLFRDAPPRRTSPSRPPLTAAAAFSFFISTADL